MANTKRKRMPTIDQKIVSRIQEIKGCNATKAWEYHNFKMQLVSLKYSGDE